MRGDRVAKGGARRRVDRWQKGPGRGWGSSDTAQEGSARNHTGKAVVGGKHCQDC